MTDNFNQSFTTRHCGALCCNGQPYIKFINEKAVIPTWEMFNIERCWKKNIRNLCDIVCPEKNQCKLHRKLNIFTFFSECIRNRNTERIDVVSKILIKENCKHEYCMNGWCFEIFETEHITKPGTRCKYL